jgi:flagellin-like hook-associated protein FlgL
MERLSSGMRINRAGDDAAGLAISEKMRGQIRGLEASYKEMLKMVFQLIANCRRCTK